MHSKVGAARLLPLRFPHGGESVSKPHLGAVRLCDSRRFRLFSGRHGAVTGAFGALGFPYRRHSERYTSRNIILFARNFRPQRLLQECPSATRTLRCCIPPRLECLVQYRPLGLGDENNVMRSSAVHRGKSRIVATQVFQCLLRCKPELTLGRELTRHFIGRDGVSRCSHYTNLTFYFIQGCP